MTPLRAAGAFVLVLAATGMGCSSDEADGGPNPGGAGGAAGGGGKAGSAGTAAGGVAGTSGGGTSGGAAGAGGGAGGGGTAGSGGTSNTGGSSAWPAPSPCDEGTQTGLCGDGVAEASCGDQVTFFKQAMTDTATAYWEVPKPKGGFRMADKYAQGNAYLRLEVTSKPTSIEVFPQVCFWRWDPTAECKDRWKTFAETCSSQSAFSYKSTSVSYVSLGTPSKWWQKASPAWNYGLPWDAMRVLQKAEQAGSKYLLQDGSCGSACWPVAGGAAAHMPINMSGELILVAAGKAFQKPAHWTGCSAAWCS